MRNLLLFFCLSVLSLGASAQIVQKGTVKEYNEKAEKTPLVGVEIKVRSAGSTVSDDKGDFLLNFVTLKPGDKVNVRAIEKLGYELFNKEAIEQWNINPKNPFLIVMCQTAKFKKIRDNYERLSSASYAEQLKKEQRALANLKETGKIKEAEYQKRLAELQERYELQLDNLSNYVDRFARIDLSELSQIEQDIIELVQQGKMEEAILKYEEQNIVEKYIEEIGKNKQLSEAINQLEERRTYSDENCEQYLASIKRQIGVLNLIGGQENIQKISEIYDRILEQDGSNLKIAVDYIEFLNTYLQYDKALEVYERVCPYLDTDLILKEKILTKAGNSFNQLQLLKESLDCYQQAILTLDSSNISDEEYKRLRKESIKNNIGLAYLRMRDYKSASEIFEECLQMHNSFNDNNIQKIKCINNLAIVYRHMNKFDEADEILLDGLASLDNMDVSDDAQKEEIMYSKTALKSERGNVAATKGDLEMARLNYGQAISEIQSLYEKNPQKYGIDLAQLNFNYGRSYFVENDSLRDALPYFSKALDHYESALKTCFIQMLADAYAKTVSMIGRIYANNNDTIECLRLVDRIDQVLTLCAVYPYKGANLLESAAIIYGDAKIYDKSIEYHKKALNAMEVMQAEYPKIYRDDVARIYSNLAIMYFKEDNLLEGKECLEKGISLRKDMYDDGETEKETYTDALFLGFCFLQNTAEYMKGLDYLRSLQKLDPDNQKLYEYECIILYHHGYEDDAKGVFMKLLERVPSYPKDSELYQVLGPH